MVEGSVLYLCIDNETLSHLRTGLLIPNNHQRDGILAVFLTIYSVSLILSFTVSKSNVLLEM